MSITINGLECVRLECEHCGNTSDLLSIRSLPMVLCECCIKYVGDEELGIEPMEERFIQFLKDNDALEKFSANLFDEFGGTIGEHIGEHIASVGPDKFIVSAFTWYDTEEGNDYWLGIDKLWHEQLNIEPMDKE